MRGFVLLSLALLAPEPPLPVFKITPRKKEDTVATELSKDAVRFVVRSPSGIGGVVIERGVGDWPQVVTLRLHLKGLENFRVSNGAMTLDAAVSIRDGKILARLWQDGDEKKTPDEKHRLEIRAIDGDGNPARELPLKAGFFEIWLPPAFFAINPGSLTLAWIDFYRS